MRKRKGADIDPFLICDLRKFDLRQMLTGGKVDVAQVKERKSIR